MPCFYRHIGVFSFQAPQSLHIYGSEHHQHHWLNLFCSREND